MRKPYSYTVLSDKRCKKCGSFLKANLVEKKPAADLCYKCYRATRGINDGTR
jgi:hypothetical protein